MYHWLLATVILTFQEVVTLNALLFKTHQGLYTLWIIHTIFLIATAFDIWIGYRIGTYAKKKFTTGKIVNFANRASARFHAYVGRRGRKFALFLLGGFSFPYVNAFIASWLDIPFWEMFLWLFLGNMITYVTSWALVLGVATVLPGSSWGLALVVGITLVLVLSFKRMRK